MKTVVFGLFDDTSDARRVLDQLAGSPLDLETVSVVHRDPAVQEALGAEAGLPRRRVLSTGALVGALLGAAAGAYLGTAALAVLGPLLTMGLGAAAGAILGAAAAVLTDRARVPAPLADDLVEALGGGATVLTVRTSNLATARAIRDLFEAGGSRLLGPPEQQAQPATGLGPPGAPESPDAGAPADHALFAPPWRRTPFAARPPRGISPDLESAPAPDPGPDREDTDEAPDAP